MNASRPCRVAFVGAGYMTIEHAKAFRGLPNVELAGIYSRTESKARQVAEQLGIAQVCLSVEALYAATNADLVVVSVPELSMNAVSAACFRLPWTVMLEKPAGYNIADARAIRANAASSGSRVFVALNRRWYSSTQAALADLNQDSGPRFIKIQDQQDQRVARTIGHPEEVAANWMFANSIHVIDYFRVFGRGRVRCVDPVLRWNPEQPGVVLARIEFDSGDVGLYEGIWHGGPGPWAATITTPNRRWEMRPLEQAVSQLAGTRQIVAAEIDPRDKEFKAGLVKQAELAVAAARGQATALPTLDDALESMELVAAVFR